MARSKHLAFCRIRAAEWLRWEPAELVNDEGYLEVMVLGYDLGIPINEIYEWGVEIGPPLDEELREEKD